MNLDAKFICEAWADRLKKKVIPSFISKNHTAYLKGRFISEGGRLTSDILKIADNLKIKRFLMILDIEKVFDSIYHLFLITGL